ncbi:MAG: NADH-quinone oxidoreductase subunit [Clostridia bacterium]|nr:NADH-quinone oxidoreductase subunit [Clostridia bacterium]
MYENIEQLQLFFPEVTIENGIDMTTVNVPVEKLLPVMKQLKDNFGFNYLAGLTAVDYNEEDRIEVAYHLMGIPEAKEIRVKVNLNREKPEVCSVTSIWPAANVQERETYDLLGVIFKGHPNLTRILCPDDMVGHPLRKDFKKEGGE